LGQQLPSLQMQVPMQLAMRRPLLPQAPGMVLGPPHNHLQQQLAMQMPVQPLPTPLPAPVPAPAPLPAPVPVPRLVDSDDEGPRRRTKKEYADRISLLHLMFPPNNEPALIKAGAELCILQNHRGPVSSNARVLTEAVLTDKGALRTADGVEYATPSEWYRATTKQNNQSGWKTVRLKNDLKVNLRQLKNKYMQLIQQLQQLPQQQQQQQPCHRRQQDSSNSTLTGKPENGTDSLQ